jgi:hypothetical protein
LALEPFTVTFPAFFEIDSEPACDLSLTLSCGSGSCHDINETRQRRQRHTSTQSSSSTFPLASTLTCFKVSLARSYDVPLDCSACNTVDLSTRPGVSVLNPLQSVLAMDTAEFNLFTHLNLLMKSNISSRDTSGYFLCSLRASMA